MLGSKDRRRRGSKPHVQNQAELAFLASASMQRQPRATPVFHDVSCMKRSFRFHWRSCEPRAVLPGRENARAQGDQFGPVVYLYRMGLKAQQQRQACMYGWAARCTLTVTGFLPLLIPTFTRSIARISKLVNHTNNSLLSIVILV
jgi:hypothetical protein